MDTREERAQGLNSRRFRRVQVFDGMYAPVHGRQNLFASAGVDNNVGPRQHRGEALAIR